MNAIIHNWLGGWTPLPILAKPLLLCCLVVSYLLLVGVFWLTGAFFLIADVTGRPKWMLSYKVQKGANIPVSMSEAESYGTRRILDEYWMKLRCEPQSLYRILRTKFLSLYVQSENESPQFSY